MRPLRRRPDELGPGETSGTAGRRPRRRTGRRNLPPRRVEAATLALAAAELQAELGIFESFNDAATKAGVAFGLRPGALEKRCPKEARVGPTAVLRERMRRFVKPEDQAAWLLERIREAVEQDKEAEITP